MLQKICASQKELPWYPDQPEAFQWGSTIIHPSKVFWFRTCSGFTLNSWSQLTHSVLPPHQASGQLIPAIVESCIRFINLNGKSKSVENASFYQSFHLNHCFSYLLIVFLSGKVYIMRDCSECQDLSWWWISWRMRLRKVCALGDDILLPFSEH